jgi:hypothetical protein
MALAVLTTGCGYHVAGRADLLPRTVKTIAVPAFDNLTTRYRLSARLATAVSREFTGRTRYRIVADPNEADAVLKGAVVNVSSYTSIVDQVSGRATGAQILVMLHVTLTERATGAVLFSRPSLEVRERYEISVDPQAYFDESDVALDRLSRSVAKTIVSSILENF